jgi:cyclophilin family peptidyl-prolyl cis-trans isomerase
MATSGRPESNGSQFFIYLGDPADRPPRSYTIFGKVIAGTDVVDAIGKLPVNDPQIGVPLDPAIIDSVTVQAAPAASPTSVS